MDKAGEYHFDVASKIARQMGMREHGFKSFGPWIREFHLCAGLFVSPFILVFAISAILLNHTCEPWEAPSDATVETKAGIQLTTGMEDLELARSIMAQVGVVGEVEFVNFPPEQTRLEIPVVKPGQRILITVDRQV